MSSSPSFCEHRDRASSARESKRRPSSASVAGQGSEATSGERLELERAGIWRAGVSRPALGTRLLGIEPCQLRTPKMLTDCKRARNTREHQITTDCILLIVRITAIHPESSIELITQRSQVQILPPQPNFFDSSRGSDHRVPEAVPSSSTRLKD